jgi:hypothetical protein
MTQLIEFACKAEHEVQGRRSRTYSNTFAGRNSSSSSAPALPAPSTPTLREKTATPAGAASATGADEDITSMGMHEASPLDIQPIQGPITRAHVRQLNLEVSSFLSVPINNFKNDLLPIVYNVIRNQGEDQEIHGRRFGSVEGQQGEAKSHGGPLQLKFESNSGSKSCLR